MESEELSTEEKILKAAMEVFLRDGYDGSRMQDIADVAGINKALLHYYFRSKDKLFEKVFDFKIQSFFPQVDAAFDQEGPFIDKITFFIEAYIHFLRKNPFLPLFVLNTVNNKDKADFIKKIPIGIAHKIVPRYYADLKEGKVRPLDPVQFIMTVMGMCVFPFLAKPIFVSMLKIEDHNFDMIMEARINELKTYVKLILTP